LGFWIMGFFSEGENSSMESREGFAGHGHTRSPTPCAPIQLAASLGRLSRSKSYSNLLASWLEVRTHPFFLLTYALWKILLRESGFFMWFGGFRV
jgi:hypothetical protein